MCFVQAGDSVVYVSGVFKDATLGDVELDQRGRVGQTLVDVKQRTLKIAQIVKVLRQKVKEPDEAARGLDLVALFHHARTFEQRQEFEAQPLQLGKL